MRFSFSNGLREFAAMSFPEFSCFRRRGEKTVTFDEPVLGIELSDASVRNPMGLIQGQGLLNLEREWTETAERGGDRRWRLTVKSRSCLSGNAGPSAASPGSDGRRRSRPSR